MSYHGRWSFPVEFDDRYPLSQTTYASYFGVDGSPVLTNQMDYEPKSDLNWAEINGLAEQHKDRTSPLFTSGRLLPGYTGARRPARNQDAEELLDRMNDDRSLPRGDYDLAYVRDFCTCSGDMKGYAIKLANADPSDFRFRLYKA